MINSWFNKVCSFLPSHNLSITTATVYKPALCLANNYAAANQIKMKSDFPHAVASLPLAQTERNKVALFILEMRLSQIVTEMCIVSTLIQATTEIYNYVFKSWDGYLHLLQMLSSRNWYLSSILLFSCDIALAWRTWRDIYETIDLHSYYFVNLHLGGTIVTLDREPLTEHVNM